MSLEWLAPVLDVVSDIGTNIVNWFSQEKTNEQNRQIHQSDQDFQAAQTQAAWERDDTAHQREVADLEAAGLSPLANTTGNAVTSPLGSASPMAMQAPQFSATTAINTLLQAEQLKENKRHNLEQEGVSNAELRLKGEEIKNKTRELDIKDREVKQQLDLAVAQVQQVDKQLDEVNRHNKSEESLKKLQYVSEMFVKETEQATHGRFKPEHYYDIDKYSAAQEKWCDEYDAFLDELKEEATRISSSTSKANSGGGGVGGGVEGFQINLNGQGAHSESQSESKDISKYQEEQIQNWIAKHPMPVFHYFNPDNYKD